MNGKIASYIARRFMLARKRSRSVGVVTGVSIAGIAVATLAMVCVLSVYNGFDALLSSQLSSLSPDIKITPYKGKTLDASPKILSRIATIDGVETVGAEIEDNALAMANDRQYPIKVRGVEPAVFKATTAIDDMVQPGGKYELGSTMISGVNNDEEFDFESGGEGDETMPEASSVASIGVAANLELLTDENLTIYAPRRLGKVSLANPMQAFTTGTFRVCGIYRSNQKEFDADAVLISIDEARKLFQYDNEATSISVQIKENADIKAVCDNIERILPGCTAKNRMEQHEINFRMINIEKWVTFMLLAFILVVASFNVISSMSMLALEKKEGLATLYSLGLTRRNVGSIFVYDSLYVMLCGGIIGIILGVVLCLLQQHFGFIRLNADAELLVIQAYPVKVKWSDLIIILAPLVCIGLATGFTASSYARTLLRKANRPIE